MPRRSLATLLAAALFGCGSTAFVSTWQEPLDGPIQFQGKRVAAVVIHPDPIVRRSGEAALARELSRRGAQGLAASSLYRGEPPEERDAARRLLEDANVEGAVVLRPVGAVQAVSSEPGAGPWFSAPFYGSFYGYWGSGWAATRGSGYLRTDSLVYVEAMIYSVAEDKLLWAGRSRTTNPSDVEKLVRELSAAAAAEMRRAGFIS